MDKTGPAGNGPKTGAQMGDCEGAKPQKRPFDGRGQGMGRGRGSKLGLGLRRWFGRGRGRNQDN